MIWHLSWLMTCASDPPHTSVVCMNVRASKEVLAGANAAVDMGSALSSKMAHSASALRCLSQHH